MVNEGRLKQAAPRLMRAADALQTGVRRIAAVPRPAADEARLERWLGFSKDGVELLREMGSSLRRGDRSATQRLANGLLRETKRANATVVGFGFNYCRVKPARFA